MIPYGRHSIDDNDVAAVSEVLRSEFLTQGPAVPRFEEEVAKYCGAQYGVAVNSATSALHIACLALGVGPGDRVWTSPNTFVASANCARLCGADVDFVDIDPTTLNLCMRELARKLEEAWKEGLLPKVVIPVHFAGCPCDMVKLAELARHYNFMIIEDASHAIGARYPNGIVGSCEFSDATVFSFHPVKVITAGEGGLVSTNNSKLAATMSRLRSHGVTRDQEMLTAESDGPWYYQQIELGLNYRMTDIQAGLALSQLGRLDHFIARRRQLAARYNKLLNGISKISLPDLRSQSFSALHLYVVHVPANIRRFVFEFMRMAKIGVNVHYIPVHLQPYYRQFGFGFGSFPNAEEHYSTAISLPIFPSLSDSDQDFVVDTLRQALEVLE